MSFVDEKILAAVEPVPEDVTQGYSGREKRMKERGYRSYERLKKYHAVKAPKAPANESIASNLPNTYTVRSTGKLQPTKVKIPAALKKFRKTDSGEFKSGIPVNTEPNLSIIASEKSKLFAEMPVTTNANESLRDFLSINITKKTNSPSERIGSLYSPQADGLSPVKLRARNFHNVAFRLDDLDFRNTSGVDEQSKSARGTDEHSPSKNHKFRGKNLAVIISTEFDDDEKEQILSDEEISVPKNNFLPLELFDGEESEMHSPEEWVELGKQSGGTKAKTKYFDGQSYVMRPCRVVGYNHENNSFQVQWEHNNQSKFVKRLNLCFDDENEVLFQQRVKMAILRRMKYEKQERYNLQIDKIADSEVTLISEGQEDRILNLVASEFPIRHLDVIEVAINDMKDNYKHSVKQSITEYFLKRPETQEHFSTLELPRPKERPPAPQFGVISIPAYDFYGIRDFIEKHIFYSHKALIDTLRTVHDQIKIFKDDKMIDITLEELALPCKLEEWCDLQNKTITKIANKLKDEWSSKATTVVQNGLNGSNNFYEDDIERFKSRRLYRVLRLINLIMSFQLRDMARQALQSFAVFMDQYKVDDQEFNSLEANGRTPLFSIQIVVDKREVVFRPTLETVQESIKYMFDNVIDDTDQVPGVGPKLFPLLTLDEKDYILPSLKKDDQIFLNAWNSCETIIVDNTKGPHRLLEMFKEFEHFLSYDVEEYADDFMSKEFKLEELRTELKKLNDATSKIQMKSLDAVSFNLFEVTCGHIKEVLMNRTMGTATALLQRLADNGAKESRKIASGFEEVYHKIQIIPTNAEELAELKEYLMKCSGEVDQLQSRFITVQERFRLLNEFSFQISEEHFRAYIETYSWPKKVYAVLQDTNIRLEEDKRKFMDELTDSVATLLGDIEYFGKQLNEFSRFNDLESIEEYYERINIMHAKITDAKEKAKLFNSRERMFNWKQTEFSKLQELAETFEPSQSLWTIAYNESQRYPEWMDGQFKMLNPTEVEMNSVQWFDTLKKLEKKLVDPGPKNVATTLRKKLGEFKKHTGLIAALRNDGLRSRHWTKISNLIGKTIDQNDLTLRDLLDMNLSQFLPQIQEISAFASQELKITRSLQEMEDAWKTMAFEVAPYGTTWKLVELDDLQTMLDEHIVLTQSMRSSPYVKEIETDVINWERKLIDRQDILDQWIKCQVAWLYLEPIFTSQDITTQLPDEATKFGIVDKSWRAIMDITQKTKIVTEVMTIENLLVNFMSHNKMLDEIHKGLKDYIETKRKKFPRFYFLSDDELLEILSETKDPLRVQKHLRKCFEGIDKLRFTENKEIIAMLSKEKEEISFTRAIVPNDYSGKVELWLLEIEKEMRVSIREVIEKAIHAYTTTKRSQWIINWQGQVVLAVSQLFWTREVEEAIKIGGVKGIQKYLAKLERQMKELVDNVRGKLSPLARITLGALVVMDVHAKDVVSNLVKEEVNDISDFEWQNQLRYYWEGDSTPQLLVRQVTAQLAYGYEYLGNTGRLVITPLTDRCYRTLMSALQLNKGGAPEGPAGTGKTETTKDLAKAIAKFCVVYNCSDTLDADGMEKFFKGLASSGAWSCFDEFNRIRLEVLSVVAQQIQQIQLAVAANQTRFFFEGFEIDIDPSCAIFITMNPGYAGRSELPDNLKALFRPVAMMIPDYAMIAEISLFSYGFHEGRNLARKIVATYRLCSEQLSSQDHYDYGMRAVKAVLVRAGTLKQQFPDDREDQLMLRAIVDVNLPKFLAEDIPLFEGIISDLFPSVVVPKPDYSELLACIEESCAERNLQFVKVFSDKIIQLYEMIIVRHGLMLVGYPFAGKTSSYRVLKDALMKMNKKGLEEKVYYTVISPKAVTMGQLYGSADLATKEWRDGVLAVYFRKFAEMKGLDRKWLIFDGPVDALWIESMNTVLDDNRKLCLPNGQIVKMAENMNLIFEVQDLAVASPATVSRCGMVYMEPSDLGWRPIVESWMNKYLPIGLTDKPTIQFLWQLFDWLIPRVTEFLSRNITEYISTSAMSQTNSMLNLLESLLDEFTNEEAAAKMKPRDKTVTIESLILFSIVWGMGATGDEKSRTSLDKFLRDELSGSNANQKPVAYKFLNPFPATDTIYDYTFDKESRSWMAWMKTIPEWSVPKNAQFHDIIVPTTDTTRYSFLLDVLATHHKPVIFVGPTGTGKSVYIKQKLLNGINREKYVPNFINMSARTSANQTQDIFESKLDKRKKGTLGAPIGKRNIIFIDDMNLPALEEYGAQPPIELLRQYMDHGGWYDRNDKQAAFTNIVDVQLVGAMGPPGGGRNPVTTRFTRHFNIIGLTPFDNVTLKIIFSEILNWYLSGTSLMSFGKLIVTAAVDMYNTVAAIFKPTPAKSHYTFNLRDLSRVFQGILSANVKTIDDKDKLLRLWSHESMRVFQDRLVDSTDRDKFNNLLKTMLKTHFQADFDQLLGSKELIYANFLEPDVDDNYVEVNDITQLSNVISSSLDDYNDNPTNQKMDLVLFKYAIDHITRISRIITQPYGNALLIGVGGSGRQSLTRLATYVATLRLFQITLTKKFGLNEWKDRMKVLLRQTGVDGLDTVFLFSDSQIKHEGFLEDISNLLNTGEIPNLFAPDELKEIFEILRPIARKLGKDQSSAGLYSLFVERCKNHLHIVVCMSPIGGALRNYLRSFPSLVNCCTIDWFSEWPADALNSVARNAYKSIRTLEGFVEQCVAACVHFHSTVVDLSDQFFLKTKRYNYVTPTTYLDMLEMFKKLATEKDKEIRSEKNKYDSGNERIRQTEIQVAEMQLELENLKPELIKLSEQNEQLSKNIKLESEEAGQKRKLVEEEEAIMMKQNEENEKVREYCAEQLAKALPALTRAQEAIKNLKDQEIVEVRALPNPPEGVKVVMKAVLIMKGLGPGQKTDDFGKKTEDWWTPSKKMMGEKGFLTSIRNFNTDTIKDEYIAKLLPVINSVEFSEEKIKNANKAAQSIRQWVVALVEYHESNKVVKPRKAALEKAEAEYAESMRKLEEKKEMIRQLEEKLELLAQQQKECQEKQDKLTNEYNDVSMKLDRAQKLIELLSGEKERWSETSKELAIKQKHLVGDMLLSSGIISYLGAFTGQFRDEIIVEWMQYLAKENILYSQDYTLAKISGDALRIRHWNMQGLPADSFSIDNAIIVENTRRWPLFIDPQGQARNWIKNYEEEKGSYLSIKMSDPNLIRSLEQAIELGTAAIIENVAEEIDPALEPLLSKQTFTVGNQKLMKLSDKPVVYKDSFRLYLITNISNPHYLPEVSTRVTLVNFMITPKGLQDQLLGIVVVNEEKKLEDEKNRLVKENAESLILLKTIDQEILELLVSTPREEILAGTKVLNTLVNSKQLSKKTKARQIEAAKTEIRIDEKRNHFLPVAVNGATLFFAVMELPNVDPMYQFSLKWYKELFTSCISETKQDGDRIENLKDYFNITLYEKICRALFEKDKLLLSFLICVSLMQKDGKLNPQELRFLLTGGSLVDSSNYSNPAKEWISEKSWSEINNITVLEGFEDFRNSIIQDVHQWSTVANSLQPHLETFPGKWNNCNLLQKMLIIRCIRPDRLIPAINHFVSANMDERFIKPPQFNIKLSFSDSTCIKPLVFILSPGVDPMERLRKFSEAEGRLLETLSLGQNQGPKAVDMISKASVRGNWVVLQNCHLDVGWLPTLEKICEDMDAGKTADSFRLWLTSMPSDKFPVSILQGSIKITDEPPKGLKANLTKSWNSDLISDSSFFTGCKKPKELKKLLFGLCFFHALIQERRAFGSLGWNIPYEFNESDLRICTEQLRLFLNTQPYIPFKALNYLTGECNYGGRVTDDHDRTTLMALLQDFYIEDILEDGYKFSPSGLYYAPKDGDHGSYMEYISKLPMEPQPEVFGLNENANITKNTAEAMSLFSSFLLTQERGSASGGQSFDQVVYKQAEDILTKMPLPFNIEDAKKRYPVKYKESMNTVLVQELIRYNRLIVVVRDTTTNVQKAIKGEVVMDEQLEALSNSIYDGEIPSLWRKKSYPSSKSLGGYIIDLLKRIEFLQTWLDHGTPTVFWISGFYFTQSFLTGIKQNFARAGDKRIEIDTIDFDFEVMKDVPTHPPTTGCYVYGLFLEGARWDPVTEALADSKPKSLFDALPVVWLKPMEAHLIEQHQSYSCPVYKTSERRGTLSTTGHSTNFVMTMKLPSEHDEKYWVKRGCALLCQLD